jgi:hypothetical protein
MFYGDMAEKSKVIRIPDIAPIGFENLLRYAYTGLIFHFIIFYVIQVFNFIFFYLSSIDSLNLNSVEDAMLTAYAAKKYLLPHLLRYAFNNQFIP